MDEFPDSYRTVIRRILHLSSQKEWIPLQNVYRSEVSKSTVSKCVKELEKLGIVETKLGRKRRSVVSPYSKGRYQREVEIKHVRLSKKYREVLEEYFQQGMSSR